MWKEFYANSTLLDLPLFAMGLFMIGFVIAVAFALKRKDAGDDDVSRLPLTPDDRQLEEGGQHV
jgi:hypothetical protein